MLDSSSILVFCRLLGLFTVAPIWGQSEIPPTMKGLIILGITSVVAPFVPHLTAEPASPAAWGLHILFEFGVGFFLGLVGRLVLLVLDMVGEVMSFQMGLSFSTVMNPSLQSQTTLPSHILTQCGVIIMLSLGMHHMFLRGLMDSYSVVISTSDCAQHLVQSMQVFFASAMRLSMPFLVLHIFLQVTLGLLNRFVPSLSFFAISLPVQLWGGLVVMLATIIALLGEFPDLIKSMWPF